MIIAAVLTALSKGMEQGWIMQQGGDAVCGENRGRGSASGAAGAAEKRKGDKFLKNAQQK